MRRIAAPTLSTVVTTGRTREEAPLREFEDFAAESRPRLQRALVARYGVEIGAEATADAIAYAWEHWDRVGAMDNAIGYLWRVAQTSVRRHHRWSRRATFPAERLGADASTTTEMTNLDADTLPRGLAELKPDVRVALLLVHGYDWSYAEVATLLDVPVSTVRNHVHRGLQRLRRSLEES